MKIDKEKVERIAHLARLEVENPEKMIREMSKILDFMDKLNELDTSGVAPLIYMSEHENRTRNDLAEPPLTQEESLRNAPSKDENYFRVPKMIK